MSSCLFSGPSRATSPGLNHTNKTSSAHPDPGTQLKNYSQEGDVKNNKIRKDNPLFIPIDWGNSHVTAAKGRIKIC